MTDRTTRDRDKYFLTTKRLAFASWQLEDLDKAQTLWTEPEVNRLISNGGFSLIEAKDRLSKEIYYQNALGYQYWPLYLLADNLHIGCCGFHPVAFDKGENILELGYHLRHKYWHQGYATEAALACIDYAFDHLKVKEIQAGHHPDNLSSARVLTKLGFEQIEDQYYQPTGLKHPTYRLKGRAD